MNSIIKSKVLLFLIALIIPTIIFLVTAYMISILAKGNLESISNICTIMVTYLLISSAEQFNKDNIWNALGASFGIMLGASLLYHLIITSFIESNTHTFNIVIGEHGKIILFFIYEWILSILMWTYNLLKIQKDTTTSENISNDHDDLIGGWYGVDSKLSCFLPVLAFEKNHIATFSDGKNIKEYNYRICCSTCIILIAEDGEKVPVKRIWVKGKTHLFYKEQTFTRDGKHCE